ncbi:MAG: hypothetical protein FJ096_15605 [Deltaproteobacteria bacterium]|nr:hypothetical protein [Deltaproteobacteria bacterium]
MTGFDYQPLYCEENVFRLLAHPQLVRSRRFALFITNRSRRVAMWAQRAAASTDPIVWDYHVVLLTLAPARIWDLDTRLPVPCDLERYLAQSFLPLEPAVASLAPAFRLVPAAELIATFASDRRHMRTSEGGFTAPPPPWPPPGVGSTLERYLDLEDAIAGRILASVAALRQAIGALEVTNEDG